jgi:3-hydroxyisobutyrate dehydrogenase-like beta-hydroxyacid dehydrogenase
VELLPTLDDVVRTADVLVSVVLPEAAEPLAQQCAKRQRFATSNCLFIDANSIDLNTLSSIHGIVEGSGIRFVDAAIHGTAARLGEMGVMYVSGVHASEAEPLLGRAMRVLPLGDQVGQASRMKLLMASQSKCLNLLFLQIAVFADHAGMLEQFLAEARTFYPEVMVAIERMLPTYPQHAARRVTELQSIERFAQSVDAPHEIIGAAREFLQAVAGEWNGKLRPTRPCDISTIIRQAAAAAPPKPEEYVYEF